MGTAQVESKLKGNFETSLSLYSFKGSRVETLARCREGRPRSVCVIKREKERRLGLGFRV
jgi:hypothetical protein